MKTKLLCDCNSIHVSVRSLRSRTLIVRDDIQYTPFVDCVRIVSPRMNPDVYIVWYFTYVGG